MDPTRLGRPATRRGATRLPPLQTTTRFLHDWSHGESTILSYEMLQDQTTIKIRLSFGVNASLSEERGQDWNWDSMDRTDPQVRRGTKRRRGRGVRWTSWQASGRHWSSLYVPKYLSRG